MNIKPTLQELEDDHHKLYQAFLPTLEHYQEMAKKALDLQTAIFIERVFRDLDCVVKERHLVIAVSARETPAKFKQVMEEIKKNQVKVTEVIYDPRTFNFLLFAKL